mgnify:FL=1
MADFDTYFVGEYGVLVHNNCLGGSFKEVNASKKANQVAHHTPQNAFNISIGIKRGDGPAVLMDISDHELTRTFGGKGKGTMVTDKLLNAFERLELDI